MCGGPSDKFAMTPQEISGLRQKSSSAVRSCCDCVYKDDRGRAVDGVRQVVNPRSAAQAGGPDLFTINRTLDPPEWAGEVMIDQVGRRVIVTTRMKLINKTGKRSSFTMSGSKANYPNYSDEELNIIYQTKIIPSIRSYWNTKPYAIEVIDGRCNIKYQVFFNPVLVTSGQHYEIEVSNSNLRSNVAQNRRTPSKFDLLDPSSAGNPKASPATLEAHEYGHMLGLLDEYVELEDFSGDGDGLDSAEFTRNPDGSRGSLVRITADNDVNTSPKVAGSVRNMNASRYIYRREKDLGGCTYTYPDQSKTVENVRASGSLMSGSRSNRTGAKENRYMIPVAEAIVALLAKNGFTVNDVKIS